MQGNFDTSKMLINFLLCPKGKKLVEFFPELGSFTEFTRQKDENILKVAFCTADADSPFHKLRSDREIMISSIFDFLSIDRSKESGKKFYQAVLNYSHNEVADCCSAYLQMQYNVDFDDWAITRQTYDMLLSEASKPKPENKDPLVYSNERVKLRNQIRALGEDLKKIEPMVFKDSKMAKPVAMAERRKIKSYPEKYAKVQSLM